MRRFNPALVLILAIGCTNAGQSTSPLTLGRQATADFYEGRLGTLWQRFSPEMKAIAGTEKDLTEFQQYVRSQFGIETGVIDERVSRGDTYIRIANFDGTRFPVRLTWVFGPRGQVVGFAVRAEVPDETVLTLN
jgi:hypothetical protein